MIRSLALSAQINLLLSKEYYILLLILYIMACYVLLGLRPTSCLLGLAFANSFIALRRFSLVTDMIKDMSIGMVIFFKIWLSVS